MFFSGGYAYEIINILEFLLSMQELIYITEVKEVKTCKNHENGTLFGNVLNFTDKC